MLAQASEVAEHNTRDLQAGQKLKAASVLAVWKQEDVNSATHVRAGGMPWNRSNSASQCYHCRGCHQSPECRFREASCKNCGKKGHIARVCRSKSKQYRKPARETHLLTEERGQTDKR